MSTTDQTKQHMTLAEIEKKEPTQSERFMTKVISEFGSSVGEVALTNFQKRLAQNYFVALDAILKTTEEKRLKKSEKFRDAVPVTWQHVNMEKLARDVVAMARVGFDPSQPNHINPIPYKNKHTGKYDITFIEGYRGIELKATKYGLEVPDHVTVELVYSSDKFKPIKKDSKNQFEGYEFEIVNAFDRGNIIGGFYYHSFSKVPEKNKLVVMTKKISKRESLIMLLRNSGAEKRTNGKITKRLARKQLKAGMTRWPGRLFTAPPMATLLSTLRRLTTTTCALSKWKVILQRRKSKRKFGRMQTDRLLILLRMVHRRMQLIARLRMIIPQVKLILIISLVMYLLWNKRWNFND